MPSLFSVIKRLQKRFGIRKVRNTWNIYGPKAKPSAILLLKKRVWTWALQRYYRTKTTPGFTSFLIFYEKAQASHLNHSLVEVEVHPGHEAYGVETELLGSNWQEQIPYSVHLVSYDDI